MTPFRAFTLIETIVYMALFALLCSGGIVAAASLEREAHVRATDALLRDEAMLVFGTLHYDWDVRGPLTVGEVSDSAMSITAQDASVTRYSLQGALLVRDSGGTYEAISSADVIVEKFLYEEVVIDGEHVGSITIMLSALTPYGQRRQWTGKEYFYFPV